MYDMKRKAELDNRISELLTEFSDVVGPWVCEIHGEEHCDCPTENFVKREGWALPVDICLVSMWVDAQESTYLDCYRPENQALTRTVGLLDVARSNLLHD